MKTRTEEVLEALEKYVNGIPLDAFVFNIPRGAHKIVRFKQDPWDNPAHDVGFSQERIQVTAQDVLHLISHHREMQSFIKTAYDTESKY